MGLRAMARASSDRGIGRVLGGHLYVPHAIDVDGQIITLFDPVTHVLAQVEEESQLIRSSDSSDQRWARLHAR